MNHPDPNGNVLIREWTQWRVNGDKSQYTVRRVMLQFTEITGINDITELTREPAETWITHLREKEKSQWSTTRVEYNQIRFRIPAYSDQLCGNYPLPTLSLERIKNSAAMLKLFARNFTKHSTKIRTFRW